ncbi:unnamed protein product [Cladocopium goreaui]|uniref:HECT-type E3 ubiquitin transferase n=1 Tax=Cladocopium goreaui TaxID=2562237 RepID=A0A9P1FSP2_9DINO|nr:unnamed protein product [Cladocopium goreaui]
MGFLYGSGFWVPKEQGQNLASLFFKFLALYAQGAAITLAQGKRRFPMVPKVHMIAHAAHQLLTQTRLGSWVENPLATTNQAQEDYIGDALFTVYACQALQTLARADAEEDGRTRLLHGLWLGLPLLSKLSLAACTNTAALDLLHCLLEASEATARNGVRAAVRSLAYALAESKDPDPEPAADTGAPATPAPEPVPAFPMPFEMNAEMLPEMEGMANNLLMAHEDELVPSWAEFHHELFQELACPSLGDGSAPDLVTLANFESKANLLAENAAVHTLDATRPGETHFTCSAIPAAWNRNMINEPEHPPPPAMDKDSPWQTVSSCRLPIFFEENALVGADEYISDPRKKGRAVLMSRRSIRSSSKVHNWAQAVSSAEQAGASAVLVFNDLDVQEPFRMGLFGEKLPKIPAFMVSGKDGAALCAAKDCDLLIVRSVLASSQATPPWPLAGGRLADLAQAWSLLEALSAHEPEELDELLQRMSVPEKRVWLTRRLVRHHRTSQQAEAAEPPLAFVEGDRWLSPQKQLEALRKQYCEGTGIGSPDICGEFEVRFRGEQGVGSAVVREWMDLVARDVYLQPSLRLLRSYDQRQTFWPDAAATFCNNCWKMDYEIMGCLIGLALWQNCTLDLPLHPHICALLFGFPPESITTSLAEMDPELHRHKVQWLLANPIDDLGVELSFSDPLGPEESKDADEEVQSLPSLLSRHQRLSGDSSSTVLMRVENSEVLLCDGVATVTDENKHRFVEFLERWKLYEGISEQINAMAKGLGKVLPEDLRQEMHGLLTPMEIAQLLSGLGTLNVEDWETHTAYTHGLHKESNVVRWFWQVVRDWANSEEVLLPQLLQFVTGSARVPVGGFSELVGFNGAKHAFTLAGANHLSKQALPVAHTCICTLDMPPYPDLETCRHKMTQMLRLGRSHFDEGAGQAET